MRDITEPAQPTSKDGKGVIRLLAPMLAAAFFVGSTGVARAWGPEGHQTVATIAAKLIEGTAAESQVKKLLGSVSLVDAAVWADCAKDVVEKADGTFAYEGEGHFPECKLFETPAGEAVMVDFVKRNANNCDRKKPNDEICHKQYHYTDISPSHDSYATTFHGARPDDIVASVKAAVIVLQGGKAPAPYSIADKREALLLLVHYVGDIHQPLHVGAVYLKASGKRANPDKGTFDAATDTQGGNLIKVVSGGSGNLHTTTWDAIPASLTRDHVDAAWVAEAKTISPADGEPTGWSVAWASDTQKQAQRAFRKLGFGPSDGKEWTVALPGTYGNLMAGIKKEQLTRGGAHLAQILQAVWPDQRQAHAHP